MIPKCFGIRHLKKERVCISHAKVKFTVGYFCNVIVPGINHNFFADVQNTDTNSYGDIMFDNGQKMICLNKIFIDDGETLKSRI